MIITRILGGLGNQLFIYAAARSLSLENNLPLKLDITSGFWLNPYKRAYALDSFKIEALVASQYESYYGIKGIMRRKVDKSLSRNKEYESRNYLEPESREFDERFYNIKVQNKIYLDGYWQSEKYFQNIRGQLLEDFKLKKDLSEDIKILIDQIKTTNSICVHIRRFNLDMKNKNAHHLTLGIDYYVKAIEKIINRVSNPVFFLFGEVDKLFIEKMNRFSNYVVVPNNKDYEDLYLMSQCKHSIISNSSFAWWGAWLNQNNEKIVLTSNPEKYSLNKDYYPENKNYLKINI
jgi:hypothetical protein